MKSSSDILKITKKKIESVIWFLGLHAFQFILFLIFMSVIIGGLVFYKYVFWVEEESPNINGSSVIKFNKAIYRDVLKRLQIDEPVISQPVTQTSNTVIDNKQTEAKYFFSEYLYLGKAGEEVKQLQKILINQGFLSGSPSGNYDSGTVNAVINFQKANNINPLGVVGPITRGVLNK